PRAGEQRARCARVRPRRPPADGHRPEARPFPGVVRQLCARAARWRYIVRALFRPPVAMVDSGMNPPPGSARSSLRSASSTLVVVAPVYNEVEGIAHFVAAVLAVMDRLTYPYTLLLVDAGRTHRDGAAREDPH